MSDEKKKAKQSPASAIAAGVSKSYEPDFENESEVPRRIVAASAALQKRGKSTFGFSMPGPLAYLQLDANYEHALNKARKAGKDVKHLRYFADPRADIKSANLAVWERFVKDFCYCVDNFRSVFIDTATELLDVRKLAEFGRNTQILQMYYGGFYADLRYMVKYALDHEANVLFVHRMKKEYVNDSWKGDYELEGWRGIVYEAPIYIEHERDNDGNFLTTVKECSQDAMLVGMTLSSADDENDFASLATRVFPDTERSDWED